LFPDRFEVSDLGEVPFGWKTGTIGDLLVLVYGRALKAGDRRPGSVPVYGSNGQVGWHDQATAPGPGIIVGRKGNPGTVTWAPTDFFVIDTAFYVVPNSTRQSLHFIYHVLRTHDLSSLAADSAVPGLNRNLAYMSPQIVPPPVLLETFEMISQPLSARVASSDQECRSLADLRDALLPRLLSGQLTVTKPERFVAGVDG
jgi:type I restriction enzyme S subunit